MNTKHAISVWTPEDGEALRLLAAEYPREIGESVMLDFIVTSEGLQA